MAFENGYALIIGVGSYTHVPQANIPISVADAQRVKAVLTDPNLCGYRSDQVTLLRDQTASRPGLLEALDRLAQQTTADHTVLLYYCGHGAPGTDGNYYLTTHDSRVANKRVLKETGLSEAELLTKLRAIRAKRMLLLFNACYSGHLSPSLGDWDEAESFGSDSLSSPTADALLSAGEGRIIITAARERQKSWIGGGELSIFTQALVDGLSGRGYVTNNHGYVSAFDLYGHIYTAVTEAATKMKKSQEPELTVLKGVGPFPVSLYRGASDLGQFDDQASVPADTAARRVDPEHSRRLFNKTVITVGDRGVVAQGPVGGSIVTGDHNIIQTAKGRNIAQASQGGQATVNDYSSSSVFDQRGQKVRTQYNIAGDYTVGPGGNRTDVILELEKLQAELAKAVQANLLDEETATDAEYQLKKAVQQAKKPEPQPKPILDHLQQAKSALEGVAAAGGLVTALAKVVELVQKFF